MDGGLILETTFLLDLERELHRGEPGPAQAFLEGHANVSLFVTFTIAGELAAGMSLDRRQRWEELVASFRVLPSNPDVCWEYGQLYPSPVIYSTGFFSEKAIDSGLGTVSGFTAAF